MQELSVSGLLLDTPIVTQHGGTHGGARAVCARDARRGNFDC